MKYKGKRSKPNTETMSIFLPFNAWLLLNVANSVSKGVYGRVRFMKLAFLADHEYKIPSTHIFYKKKIGPYSYDVKKELDYLKDIGLVQEDNQSTDEEFDLAIYRITEQGRKILSTYNPLRKYLPDIKSLLKNYCYRPLPELLTYIHERYTDPVYSAGYETILETKAFDSRMAKEFWARRIEIGETSGIPLWYLASILEDILKGAGKREIPISLNETIRELYDILLEQSMNRSLALVKGHKHEVPGGLGNLIYDKCFVVENKAIELGIIREPLDYTEQETAETIIGDMMREMHD